MSTSGCAPPPTNKKCSWFWECPVAKYLPCRPWVWSSVLPTYTQGGLGNPTVSDPITMIECVIYRGLNQLCTSTACCQTLWCTIITKCKFCGQASNTYMAEQIDPEQMVVPIATSDMVPRACQAPWAPTGWPSNTYMNTLVTPSECCHLSGWWPE